MHSGIYEGIVRHQRRAPVRHEFQYRLSMMYLDLAEVNDVFRGRWFWSSARTAPARFRREDHLGDPRQPLDEAVATAAAGLKIFLRDPAPVDSLKKLIERERKGRGRVNLVLDIDRANRVASRLPGG